MAPDKEPDVAILLVQMKFTFRIVQIEVQPHSFLIQHGKIALRNIQRL